MNSTALLAELPRLRRYARALVGDAAAADDLVQDTLERGLQKAAQWRADSDLRAWLFSIMHNLRVDQLRRPGLSMAPQGDAWGDDLADAPVRASQTDRLEVRDLDTALSRLPEAQREVLLLVALEDMPYDLIAQTLDVPIGTVMSRLSRGRERLRLILEGQQPAVTLRVVR